MIVPSELDPTRVVEFLVCSSSPMKQHESLVFFEDLVGEFDVCIEIRSKRVQYQFRDVVAAHFALLLLGTSPSLSEWLEIELNSPFFQLIVLIHYALHVQVLVSR